MKTLYTIVGASFRAGMTSLLRRLPDREPLELRRDPKNPHDENAVQVWVNNGTSMVHLGYIKATENKPLAQIMDKNGQIKPASLVFFKGMPSAEVDE